MQQFSAVDQDPRIRPSTAPSPPTIIDVEVYGIDTPRDRPWRGSGPHHRYYPHDTPWLQITDMPTLMEQCRRRSLLEDGSREELQQRLKDYQMAHRHENEARGAQWRTTFTKRGFPLIPIGHRYQLIEVYDRSWADVWGIQKEFRLIDEYRNETYTVTISKDLTCSCIKGGVSVLLPLQPENSL